MGSSCHVNEILHFINSGHQRPKTIGRAQRKGACCLTSAALARNTSVISSSAHPHRAAPRAL